jgi:hypothetical protein
MTEETIAHVQGDSPLFGSLVFEYDYSRIQIRGNVVKWMLISVN